MIIDIEFILSVYNKLQQKKERVYVLDICNYIFNTYNISTKPQSIGGILHNGGIKRMHDRNGNYISSCGYINVERAMKDRNVKNITHIIKVSNNEKSRKFLLNKASNKGWFIGNKNGDWIPVNDRLSSVVLNAFEEYDVPHRYNPSDGFRSISHINDVPVITKVSSAAYIYIEFTADTNEESEEYLCKVENQLNDWNLHYVRNRECLKL